MSQHQGPGAYPPYMHPPTYPAGPVSQGWMAPHRGGTVLTLGILSLVLCQLLGPFAWSMGSRDLRLIDQGQMDPMGRGTTQAGMVCGIIGTCLLMLWVLMLFLQFAVGLAIFGAAASAAGGGGGAPATP